MSWKQIKREGIVVKFRKLLAMVLAVAMIASLAPVLRTTAKADALEDNALKGATSSSEYQFNFSFSKPIISEVGSDKYISRTITITNIGQAVTNSSNDDGKRIKIHIFNTNDSTFTSDFPSADRLPEKGGGKDGNVNYYPYAVSKSNNDATIEFSDSSHDIYIKNPTRTDASGEYIFFDENETITIEVRHKYKKGDENKTLVNFIALYIPQKNKGDTFDYGHEIGSTSEGTVDNVVNSTPPPTGTLTVTSKLADGSTENPGTITYTVTGTGIESTGSYGDGVTPADGSLTFTLSPTDSTGVSKELTLPEGSYTVSQSEVTGWTTASEASNGSVSGGITVSASDAATATFTLTKTPTTPAGTKVTYHLNLPQDASFIGDKKGKDYVYYQGAGDILELWEIDSFTNKDDADDKIEKVDITKNKPAEDDFSSYANGYLNKATNLSQRYYFVGWSTSDTAFEANTNDYSDIKYPAVYLSGRTEDSKHTDREGYGIRGIYGYPSNFVYNPTNEAQTDKFSNAGDKDLYAIWVSSNTNAGLMGYTMQIVGGDFPGARDNHTVGNMFTGESSTGQKLGINGIGKNSTWYKYTVLDQGYKQGDEFTVVTDEPQYYGTSEDYVKGEQRVTNFVTWKLKNAGITKDGVEDKNQYIANPGDTVKYFGNYNVYSLDAVWATVTAPDKQIKGYNGETQYPNMEQLKTDFNGANSNQDIFKTLFATDNRFASASPATNAYLTYSFEITKDGTRVEPTGTSGVIPGVTEPGVYKYTIKAYYNVGKDTEIGGNKVGTTITNKLIGTVSFLFIVQPRLTLNVTKNLTGRAWKSDESFKFSVTSDKTGATVETGTLTISDNVNPNASTNVNFTAAGEYTITIKEVETPGETGMTYASDQTVEITATVDSNGFITLTNASGTTSATVGTDGNATAAVTMTNAYNQPTGNLTIKKTVDGTNHPTTWEFTFTVKATDGEIPDISYGDSITRNSDGTLTVTVNQGNTDGVTIENLPIGTYTVTEADVDGYELTAASGDDVTYSGGSSFTAAITEDGTTTAIVTNTFLTGDLTINKKVEGTNAPASDEFEFTIKAADDATKEKVANETFDSSVSFDENGSATVTITTANKEGSITIHDLPIGNYTVEETAKTHYTPNQASHNVTLDQDGETIAFINTYDQPTGSLTITKTVEGVASASSQEFTFTITALSGKTVEGVEYEVTGATQDKISFSGTTAEVTVKMDTALTKTVTIAGLPIGYYKVEEKPTSPDNYNTSYAPTAAPSTGVNVTESGGEVTVTNTHKTGNLTIRKTVTGSGPAVPDVDTFTFTITAPDGLIAAGTSFNAGTVTFTDGKTATVEITVSDTGSEITGTKIITGLPIGTYTVTEAKVDGYKADAETKSVTLTTSGATAAFTNIYQTGTLQITKTVDGIASASGKEFTFTITALSGKTVEGVEYEVTGATQDKISFSGTTATVTVKMDADLTKTVTIANLPAGTYTVEETKMAANYTVDGAKSKTVTIRGGNTEIVAITNKHDTGDLTITKNVTGGTNVKVSQTFTFTVQAPDNLIKDGTSFTVTGGAPAVFDEHGEAEVTVTLSNSNTGSVTIEGLPVGRYTITEKDVPTGYTASGPETVTVAKGTTPATATITNELQTTNLTVKKEKLEHDPNVDLPTNPTFTFAVAFTNFPAGVTSFECGTNCTVTTANNIVTFTLKENGSQTLAGIPAGIGFEVTEAFQSDDLGRHFTTEWLNRTGTLNSSTTVTCTNTYHMLEVGNGALVIRKEAVGGQADTKYQFKVTFTQGGHPYTGQIGGKTLGSDGSAIFEMDDTINHVLVIQVPVGVAYTVEEVFASGERPKKISVRLEQNEAGDSTSGETASGTISQEFNYDSVIFTNRYLGDLTISKTVPQFNGGEDFTFTVTLPTGTYNYTGDKSGTISSGGTVTLKAGESITIQNLPAGSTYTVTEAGTANYTSSSVGATGTIANNTTAEAKFTNNRNTGSLTVTKTLTGKLAASNDTFTFTVTLTGVGTGFNGTLGDVTFTNGVGTITITGARSKTITGLPVGAGFTVKEQDAAGYVTTYNNDPANHDKAEGTISANPTTVTVNNDKPDTGTITIKKVVKNAPAANANKEFNFTITLYLDEDLTEVATDVNGEHSGFNFTNGVASFTLKNGDSVIGEGEVTVGEGRLFYKIEETADPDYTTTSENTDTNGKANGRVVTGEFTQDSQNTTVTFTNTYNYGDLTITKKVTDDSGASHANDKFTFTITKVGDSTFNQTVEITGANSKTVTLPAGEYIVTETAGMGDSVAYRVGTSGASAANAEVTITAGGTVTVTVTNTYYSGGGTGGTGGGGTPSPDIDTSEHYGYIIGVTHTEVAPEQNITRAEIATILFRLLTDEARAANWSENSGFPDVKSGVWYNHAVAVLHKMGIILGDDNGNFNPDQNITRAEVAAMVVRFYEVAEGTVLNNRFTDVETTKWYAEAVLLADYYGLMQGDGDTFKPEDLLTRAEAMTVFNRLLGRKPHKDHLHKDMITWTDNTDRNKWYYAEVQEATNSHTCGNNVVIDGKIYETWSAITKMRDWAALEY